MDKTLAEWLKNNKPRGGREARLDKHKESIFQLLDEGYSKNQIKGYLKEIGIEISHSALSNYIKRNGNG